jgi:hypothetical protein
MTRVAARWWCGAITAKWCVKGSAVVALQATVERDPACKGQASMSEFHVNHGRLVVWS